MAEVDAVERGFVRLKSALLGYQAEFGEEVGMQLMALAMRMKDNSDFSTIECAAYLAEEYRAKRLSVSEPKESPE